MQLKNRIQKFLKALAGEGNVKANEQCVDETEALANKVAVRFQNGLYVHHIKIDGLTNATPYMVVFDIYNNNNIALNTKALLKAALKDVEYVAGGRLQSGTSNFWTISSIGNSGTFSYVRIFRTTTSDQATNAVLTDSETITITDIVKKVL